MFAADAVRFSPDDWMDALGIDLWEGEPRGAIEQLQWVQAQELLAAGRSVVIEWGTWARVERDRLRAGAAQLGATVELHYLTDPVEVLHERVAKRDREDPPISLANMREWAELIEVPDDEELALFDVSWVGSITDVV